jgi:ADP-heptose:LPS heptosyltransferase
LFISNSTGPLHIARVFDIPLIAFYCPAIPCSPRRWGPYNRIQSVLQPDIEPCKTGNPRKCPHGNCLESIKWEDIRILLDKRLNEIT